MGWDAREPAIVAALATRHPILLVGPHGTAKTMLLERIAQALGLAFRHYNASILNFDDLLGFPVPDPSGEQVRYVRAPNDVWDAQAVFLDEISRCRPDMQNRLFPLIYERRIQGRLIESLEHRWAAMNPPPAPDADPDEALYLGSEPLDAALADRFPWVIDVPAHLSDEDRLAVITGTHIEAGADKALAQRVAHTRGGLRLAQRAYGEAAANYVAAVADALVPSKVELSLRRQRMLYDNLIAVMAADYFDKLEDAAWVALRWSVPDRARRAIDEGLLARAHAAAQAFLRGPFDPIQRKLLRTKDPAERIRLVLHHPDSDLVTATILDVRASLDRASAMVLAYTLFAHLAEHRPELPGTLFEALGEDVGAVEGLVAERVRICEADVRSFRAQRIEQLAADVPHELEYVIDAMWAALKAKAHFDPDAVLNFAVRLRGLLEAHVATTGPVPAPEAASSASKRRRARAGAAH